MGCEIHGNMIVCSRGRKRVNCDVPGCPYGCVALCDWPMPGESRTCDKKLCAHHRRRVGANRDYCPEHFTAAMSGR